MLRLFFFIALIAMVEAACLWCMKHGREYNKNYCCYIGILGFLIVGSLFYNALGYGQITELAVVLQGLSIISAFSLGYFVFEENWTKNKTIALILTLISIAIVYNEEKAESLTSKRV